MKEKLFKLFNNPATLPILTGIVAFGAGYYIGLVRGRRPKETLQDIVDDFNKDFPIKVLSVTEEEKPGVLIIDAKDYEHLKDRDRTAIMEEVRKDEENPNIDIIRQTVFDSDTREILDIWDYEEEVKNRSPDHPFVIHRDEFFSEEADYTQICLTYYAGDEILVDEDNAPVYNHDKVVGELKFGHGSADPNVVYIRNDKRKAEFEIVKDPGLYSVEVLGLSIEHNERVARHGIQHSAVPKFKMD